MDDSIRDFIKSISGEPPAVDLHPELERAKVMHNGKCSIRHRLIIEEYEESDNQWFNQQFAEKTAEAEEFKQQGQWCDYVQRHECDFWPMVLEEISGLASKSQWLEAVRNAWINSEDIWPNYEVWRRIFLNRTRLAGIMDEGELAQLNAAFDPLTVYRGCLPEHVDGMSWTLKLEAAETFKYRAKLKGVIFRGTVKKEHVIAFLKQNNEEFEIIVFPEHVSNPQIIRDDRNLW